MRLEEKLHSLTYDWSPTALYGSVIGISVVIVWLWYCWLYLPLSCSLDAYEAQIAPMSAQIATVNDCQKNCDVLASEVDAAEQQRTECSKKCMVFASTDALVAYLFTLCQMHQITVQLFKPLSTTKHAWHTIEAFSFEFAATHEDAQQLFESIRTSCALLGITQLASTLQKDGTFMYVCTLERMVL